MTSGDRYIPRRDAIPAAIALTAWLWLVGPVLEDLLSAAQVRTLVLAMVLLVGAIGAAVYLRCLR